MKKFRLGELFCGPGGLACGALRSVSTDGSLGIEHAWANDYDLDTCITYRNNICPKSPETVYHGDVRDLKIKELGKIDAFAYGFPCNSFSNVGEHQGIANEKFGQLYWYGVEVLREYSPQWFIAENVSGIRSAGSGDFQTILADLRESGSLEQDASNIIMVWNLNDDDNCIYKGVKIAKCRQGLKGKIGMKFNGDHMTFEPRMEDFWQVQKMARENSQEKIDEIDGMFE